MRCPVERVTYGGIEISDLTERERDRGKVALAAAAKVKEQDVIAGTPEARSDAEQFVLRAAVASAADDHAAGGWPRQPPAANRNAVPCRERDCLVVDLQLP